MSFAREGRPFIVVGALLTCIALGVALQRGGGWWAVTLLLAVFSGWIAYFFRDPQRTGDRDERLVVAPADGKTVLVNEVEEPTFLQGRAQRISIFMNVFSVHVNRYPVSGTVRHVVYSPGKVLSAGSAASGAENEQSSIGVDTGTHRILVRQIAGLIARRIVTYGRQGEHVRQGERTGLIRFGSRVDVFVPGEATLRVRLGELTAAGTTILAELPAAG